MKKRASRKARPSFVIPSAARDLCGWGAKLMPVAPPTQVPRYARDEQTRCCDTLPATVNIASVIEELQKADRILTDVDNVGLWMKQDMLREIVKRLERQ
jgi:hypothetical protein